MEFSSITKAQDVERLLLPAKLLVQSPGFNPANSPNSILETWMLVVTGDTLPNLSKECGASCSRKVPLITFWGRASHTRFANFWTRHSVTSTSIGGTMLNSILVTCV